MENPFGSTEELKRYLVLMSASKDNAAMVQKALRNLQEKVYSKAAPLWIDSKGIGVFVATDMPAVDIYAAMFDTSIKGEFSDTRDALVVELGSDWFGGLEAKYGHWLTTHAGLPLPSARVRDRRR
ncbi:hypothetical protein [Pigmentiphaga sp.]|uniref:hypothetical protein n=1 Tax=Pigmentiphaga sp. TaxID=1977564 RepID=UPI00128D8FE1|nr:hypothetical protein [Pigmentiphaga sp.]MPS29424.1 hypothetical protein [Alcaligenaceae bacterium SAGV5]MPS55432.1 hypothetical protein [Alcaligenaceae bacterium SAGV3]MPT60123.1 hypothetical protein [Alcaligenaceae bacterium]